MAKKVNGVVHNMYNNATDSGGYAIPPLATNLALGQLVVNTSESDPCVLFKTSAGKIVKIVSEEVITKALTDILGNSAADLDTLRELIAQFEGSANDILPMLVALTDRVSAAETTLGNKANSSVVNAHIGNRDNPHGVTAAQVGALAVGDTAADSSKLGGATPDNVRNFCVTNAKTMAVAGGFDADSLLAIGGCMSNYAGLTYWGNAPSKMGYGTIYQVPTTYTENNGTKALTTQFAFDVNHNSETPTKSFWFRTSNNLGIKNDWKEIYHEGNVNNKATPWYCKSLIAGDIAADTFSSIEHVRNGYRALFCSAGNALRLYNIGASGDEGTLLLNKSGIQYSSDNVTFYNIFHSGNVNKPDVDWRANNLYLTGSIYNTVDNNQWLYHVKRSDNTQVRGIASDGWDLQLITNNIAQLIIKSGGNAGFGTNNPTDRIHAVGNIRATKKGIFGGNVESNGSGIFTGDIIAKKLGAVVFAANDQAAGSATRLNDLQDVKLPTNLSAKMIMAYDPAQINSDGTKGGYTFMPAVGVGTGKVVADDIESLPDITLEGSPYAAVSDKRLKDNIRPLVGATNILLNFAAKEYEWSEEGKKLGLTDPRAYGLIAQEAAELKDIVDIVRPLGISDYLGVDYIKIVPILIAGFQEQNKEIGAVNRKIEAVRTRANKAYGLEDANAKKIETLEAEVRELKKLMMN